MAPNNNNNRGWMYAEFLLGVLLFVLIGASTAQILGKTRFYLRKNEGLIREDLKIGQAIHLMKTDFRHVFLDPENKQTGFFARSEGKETFLFFSVPPNNERAISFIFYALTQTSEGAFDIRRGLTETTPSFDQIRNDGRLLLEGASKAMLSFEAGGQTFSSWGWDSTKVLFQRGIRSLPEDVNFSLIKTDGREFQVKMPLMTPLLNAKAAL